LAKSLIFILFLDPILLLIIEVIDKNATN